MLEKINVLFAGVKMTIVSGVCLLASLMMSLSGKSLIIDPAWAAIIISGIPLVYLSIWRIIYNPGISKISSALMISIAMVAAIFIGDIFAAGEVAFIMAIGAVLEEKTTERAKKGLKRLIDLVPGQGRKISDGKEEMIPAEQIKEGDVLRVLPGETIPVDGTVKTGVSSADQSIITGESLPVDKNPGDEVFCGTINCFGTIDIVSSSTGKDTSLQKLIDLVAQAEDRQAPMQRIADKAASWLVPVALSIAIISYFVTHDIVRTVTVLVVFCPCALVLATPTAIMAAIGQATKHGVIIKSGEALERMAGVDTIAFDKTGTITEGNLTVSDICTVKDGMSEEELLRLAASAEKYSEHPLGKAVAAYAEKKGVRFIEGSDFTMIPGRGISVELGDRRVRCGNLAYLGECGIDTADAENPDFTKLRDEGKAVIFIADDSGMLGFVALADNLRENVSDMIGSLRDLGMDSVLITGDHRRTADYFAQKAGIGNVHAGLLPVEKLNEITVLREQGRNVCMIGDGVNDAPALKSADVGVAMGAMGSDIAVDAADIALMSDDLSRIPYLKRLANGCLSTIKLSISLSLVINIIAVTMSILGMLTPTTGALVHNAGSCTVVLIAALLYDRKFD